MTSRDHQAFANLARSMADLADLAGRGARDHPGPDLPAMLDALLTQAGSHVLAALCHAPDLPTPREMLEGLCRQFALLGERGDPRFTGPCATGWQPSGRTSLQLRTDPGASKPHGADRHVLLMAHAIDPPLLYRAHRSPLRVQAIDLIDAAAAGPYLVLLAYDLDQDGRARPARAYARAVYSARRPMPVRSPLERDVVAYLEHLQQGLDAHGIDLEIVRGQGSAPEELTWFQLNLSCATGTVGRLAIMIDPEGVAQHDPGMAGARPTFVLTPARWARGSLTRWLALHIKV